MYSLLAWAYQIGTGYVKKEDSLPLILSLDTVSETTLLYKHVQ